MKKYLPAVIAFQIMYLYFNLQICYPYLMPMGTFAKLKTQLKKKKTSIMQTDLEKGENIGEYCLCLY